VFAKLAPTQADSTMNTEALTNIANVHQSVLTRHDQEIAGVRTLLNLTASQRRDDLNAINQVIARVAQQQEVNTQAIARQETHVAKMEALQALNQEQSNQFTTGMIELRGLVADYLKGRSETK
jgi:hypothetical protein